MNDRSFQFSLTAVGNISLFYGAWVLSCLVVLQVGLLVPVAMAAPVSYVFILTMLLGMAYLSRRYKVGVEPYLQPSTPLRLFFLGFCTLLFGISYTAVAVWGMRSNVISSLHVANLLFFACVLGHWLAVPLKRPAELIPVCLVMSLVDLYSVFKGPSKQLTNTLAAHYDSGQPGSPPVVDFILIKLPQPGQETLMPAFGVVDWVVIVMLSAAAAKFGIQDNVLSRLKGLYFPLAGVGLIVTVVAARELGLYLPVLPAIALCFLVVAAWQSSEVLHLTRNEVPALVFVAALSCVISAISFL